MVNTAVRFLVLAFVFIGGAITLAGPQLVDGKNTVAAPEKTGEAATPNSTKLTTSAKEASQKQPETTG